MATQLGYCSNIHPGEDWPLHHAQLQEHLPAVLAQIPNIRVGLGLRLANPALADFSGSDFKVWIQGQGSYVFTFNGFPYGQFHDQKVKDQVHAPDWSTPERILYTKKLFRHLVEVMPDDLSQAGVSTSPLSYRHWWPNREEAIRQLTSSILVILAELIHLKGETGKSLHLDIEPEPDGLIETGQEFVHWYTEILRPMAYVAGFSESQLVEHIQLCFDICHVAVGFESATALLLALKQHQIPIGKFQVSSALRVRWDSQIEDKVAELRAFVEPTYLHQVVGLRLDGTLDRFLDLDQALAQANPRDYTEWRIHFHVPIFLPSFGLLESTQDVIEECMAYFNQNHPTDQLEIETYTWGVLPESLQEPIHLSIAREITWLQTQLKDA